MYVTKCPGCYSENTTITSKKVKSKTQCHSALLAIFLILYIIVLKIYLKHNLFTQKMLELHLGIFCFLVVLCYPINILDIAYVCNPLFLVPFFFVFHHYLNSFVGDSIERHLSSLLQEIHMERFFFSYLVRSIIKTVCILFTRL